MVVRVDGFALRAYWKRLDKHPSSDHIEHMTKSSAEIEIRIVVHTDHGTLTIQDSADVGPELTELIYQDHGGKPVILAFTQGELETIVTALHKRLDLTKNTVLT